MSDQQIADILRRVKTIALVGVSEKIDRPSYKVLTSSPTFALRDSGGGSPLVGDD